MHRSAISIGAAPARRAGARPARRRPSRASASIASSSSRAEGVALGRALHLDEAAAVVHHHVHVGVAAGVLGVVEVEHRLRRGRCRPRPRRPRRGSGRAARSPRACAARDRVAQRDVGAGDRRGAGAAVGLQHVAVEGDACARRARARSTQARSERPIRRWISCVRPPCLPLRGLAAHARVGRARQHAVLGGDPAFALAAQEAGHAVLDAGGAQHAGVAEADQHRAFGVAGVTGARCGSCAAGRRRGRSGGRRGSWAIPTNSGSARLPFAPARPGRDDRTHRHDPQHDRLRRLRARRHRRPARLRAALGQPSLPRAVACACPRSCAPLEPRAARAASRRRSAAARSTCRCACAPRAGARPQLTLNDELLEQLALLARAASTRSSRSMTVDFIELLRYPGVVEDGRHRPARACRPRRWRCSTQTLDRIRRRARARGRQASPR